jgi:hypothetical protein
MADLHEHVNTALRGRYRVESELGRGGMAIVFRARDLRHDRQVALKVMRPELRTTLGPDRFVREIRVAAGLQHPSIVPVFDSGDAGGVLFYVMPLVEGETLRERLERQQQLSIEDALAITRDVAEALAHAHSFGLVHRDVKPENILLSGNHAWVTDFGLARAVSMADTLTTETGIAIGTPLYMSPEQAGGERELDGRADTYALACVLFEMLAGEPPFGGPTSQAILARHMSEQPPSLSVVRPTVPGGFERALRRGLAKVPADRFATPLAFSEALDAAWTRTGRGRRRAAVAVVAALAAALALGIGLRDRGPAGGTTTLSVAVLPAAGTGGAPEAARLLSQGLAAFPFLSAVDGGTLVGDTADWRGVGLGVVARAAARRNVRFVVAPEVLHEQGGDLVAADLVDAASGERVARLIGGGVAEAIPHAAGRIALEIGAAIAAREGMWLGGAPELILATTEPRAYAAVREGQRLLWTGDYTGATGAFERAITADSSYALAYVRLSVARTWLWDYEAALRPVRDAAIRWSDAHPLIRDLAGAQRHYVHRLADSAIAGYQATVRDRPENVDGWFGLGESIFHFAGFTGASLLDARHALERVVALDSAFAPIYSHLVQIALYERDEPAARRYLAVMHTDVRARPAYAAAVVLTFGSAGARDSVLRALARADRYTVSELVSHFLHRNEDLALVDSLGALLDRQGRSPEDRARGRAYRMMAKAAAGDWNGAVAAWSAGAARAFDPWLIEAELAGWPVGERTAPMWEGAERDLAAGRLPAFGRSPEDDSREMFRALVHRAVRSGTVQQAQDLLGRIPSPGDLPTEADPLPRALREALQARLALLARDTTRAVRHLAESLETVAYPHVYAMPHTAMGVERRLLAELALARNDSTTARRWVSSFWASWSMADALHRPFLEADASALGLAAEPRR